MLTVKRRLETLPAAQAPEELCILDIETLGFSPRYSPVLLLGLAYPEEGFWTLEMHLCEDPKEEPLLLSSWNQAMHRFLLFVTYNGKSFDIPFLTQRSSLQGLPLGLPRERQLDLYERGKLKDAEKEGGFVRTDTLSGKDWVALYRQFLREQAPRQKEALLLHNQEDLLGTIHLLHARPGLLDSLRHRFLGGRFLYDAVPSPGNLRLLAVDAQARKWSLDLPLLSFGRYHFLHIGERFDVLQPEEKEQLLLLSGREPDYGRIAALLESDSSSPFLVDKPWRQC